VPRCSVNTANLSFGAVAVGEAANEQFILTNVGEGTLSGTLSTLDTVFTVVGDMTYNLAANMSKTFTIQFAPHAATAYACTLSVDQDACRVICQGTGIVTTIACTVSPTALDCGSVKVGEYFNQAFDLTNNGTSTLSGTLSESCPDFSLESTASYNLAPGARVQFIVRFTPAGEGAKTCTIATGAPGCPTVTCTGSGWIQNPYCGLSTDGISFAEVALGDRADGTFQITNNGTTNLSGMLSESCPDFSLPGQTSYTLAPGASQTFIVRFAPTSLGLQFCEIPVGGGCHPLHCDGVGVIGCSYTPADIDFGYFRRGEIRCGSFTLKNNTSDLQQGELYAQGQGGDPGYLGQIVIDNVNVSGTTHLSYYLNAGNSRTFQVCWTTQNALTPCDTIAALWRIRSTDTACSGEAAIIHGVITRGCACSVSPTTLNFGDVVVGDISSWQKININSESAITGLTGRAYVASGDEFEVTTSYTCPPPPEGWCGACGGGDNWRPMSVKVWFKPIRLGPQTGQIAIESLAGCKGPGSGTICTVTVTGNGVLATH
jgi:hypothetical protein